MDGSKVDLIAEKKDITGTTSKIVIECKYLSNNRAITSNVAKEFLNTFNTHQDKEGFTHGSLVTNTRFSLDAKNILVNKIIHATLISFTLR